MRLSFITYMPALHIPVKRSGEWQENGENRGNEDELRGFFRIGSDPLCIRSDSIDSFLEEHAEWFYKTGAMTEMGLASYPCRVGFGRLLIDP